MRVIRPRIGGFRGRLARAERTALLGNTGKGKEELRLVTTPTKAREYRPALEQAERRRSKAQWKRTTRCPNQAQAFIMPIMQS
ncbi:MAG: hypothetical protein EAY75_00725 [Bacteroidetes bacterium]|nr:MAG: hypothetical protein EAY75_00725 [Bacteroidota bacterium]